ncbi:MmcQ/YjbR family DNA-binding protein [Rhodococcoides kyotonense]|uniref:Predicted DNA-binding protein, MmcQ/YjbR family n=1 Tax=Rhodococcoides kyotonense TaxID=398843 RepID=A0A239G1Z9_9NOCA|nr:MmcQ/YjbR family DNA-binding protein [Rhodococcus kyotonensis]SNS63189.1 Predicted DNA-binding protein, MmcQ/YjbR family [Rhodococcus kyotonensis]
MMASERVHAYCAALPDASLTHPFGPETSVYKVGGKIFAVIGTGDAALTVKCTPEHAEVLVGEHAGIVPGYHMNKRHWITIQLDGDVPDGLVEDLIDESHSLVHRKPGAR